MSKILGEIIFTRGKRTPGYMVTLDDGTLVFYTDNGIPCEGVGKDWLLLQELGEIDTADDFEALTGIRAVAFFDLCDDCGLVKAVDMPVCINCDAFKDCAQFRHFSR